ncbi:hypothetical protein CJF39_07400 [Pseudomonas lundensis]|uniref:Uncharacterized protein n=2 Tax=Pseudomonas TaxID=286 RepID=A0A266NDX7_9PSED|nr:MULTISPECIES: hypothetical protein [Pseudomonas]OZY60137.1 hypothetical protein CJF39_07400 [Pseudomonas lundensis]
MNAHLTLITSSNPVRLTKQFLVEDGKLVKQGAGQMVEGHANVIEAATPNALVAILSELRESQALCYGLPIAGSAPITTACNLDKAAPGTISRTAVHFEWARAAGWLMLDYDPALSGEALTPEQFREAIYSAAPALRNAPSVWGCSSSSMLFADGQQLAGIRGQRLYIQVADSRDIERAGRVLFERLWLAGFGYIAISKSGALLKRAPIDSSVWQPHRLDFAAPPVCVFPVEARRPASLVLNGGADPVITLSAIPSLNSGERMQLKDLMSDAASKMAQELHDVQVAWIDKRMDALNQLPESEREVRRATFERAVCEHKLFGDFELTHSSGDSVTVGQILDNPNKWHGERFADPLEPEYSSNDHRIAQVNLRSGGKPTLYSHAHGGQRFTLHRAVRTLKTAAGDLPRVMNDALAVVRADGVIFERAGALVRVAGGELMAVEPAWLRNHLEEQFQFQRFDRRTGDYVATDCPGDLSARIMAARGAWGVPVVAGVIHSPVMRPDGSILEVPGHDHATGLLYLSDDPGLPPVRILGRDALIDTLRRVWEPFEQFPFADDLARGVFMSALLTTVCRAALDTAPGFLVRAHSPGTGKTLLSECLMILAGASTAALPLPEKNPEEIEKRLAAKLLTGCSGLILDNLVGSIDNAALCSMLTSSSPEVRILGRSEVVTLQNRALWVLNGNNVGAGGDTFRRLLPISLDSPENPERRRFGFNPRALIRSRLAEYRADLLSVLSTYQRAGAPVVAAGGLGSFEQWESLVRQCLCWLISEGVCPAPMADPAGVLELSRAEDPEHQKLTQLLSAWHSVHGSNRVFLKELQTNCEAMGRFADVGHFTSATTEEQALNAILEEVAFHNGRFNTRAFAAWLRRNAGVIVEGLRLEQGAKSGGTAVWRVLVSREKSEVA